MPVLLSSTAFTTLGQHWHSNLPIFPGMMSKCSASLMNNGAETISDIRFHWNVNGGVW